MKHRKSLPSPMLTGLLLQPIRSPALISRRQKGRSAPLHAVGATHLNELTTLELPSAFIRL